MTVASEGGMSGAERLRERVGDWRSADVVVDAEQRFVRNVALTGIESRNGYRYSEAALRGAVALYENKPVFLDHAANLSRPYERSTRDLVGSIVNPRFEEQRVRSDIRVLDTDAGRTFLALASTANAAVGMSHVVLAERNAEKTVVERIHDVVSVDAVAFPATTSTFRESFDKNVAEPPTGSLEALLSAIDSQLDEGSRRVGVFPDHILVEICDELGSRSEGLAWSIDAGRVVVEEAIAVASELTWEGVLSERTQLERIRDERDSLRRERDQIQCEQRAAKSRGEVEELLREAQLPGCLVTAMFREQLLEAEPAARRELIDERRAVWRQVSQRMPVSRERTGDDERGVSDALLVRTLKRRG